MKLIVFHNGYDFRPSYRKIAPFINALPYRPVVGAFTATATPEIKQDIIKLLGLVEPQVFVTGFDRHNLYFSVLRGENKLEFVLDYLRANKGKSGIIYAATRKDGHAGKNCSSMVLPSVNIMPVCPRWNGWRIRKLFCVMICR